MVVSTHLDNLVRQQHSHVYVIPRCNVQENVAYGCEFFPGKRTWKEGSGGKGDAAKSEDVLVAIGHEGILLLGLENPLQLDLYVFETVGKWTVSRDGKIFAFSLEDERIVYIVTEVAGHIEHTVEKYVEEQVRARSAKDEDSKWARPRRADGPGVSGLATFVSRTPGPTPSFGLSPSELAPLTSHSSSSTLTLDGSVGAGAGASTLTSATATAAGGSGVGVGTSTAATGSSSGVTAVGSPTSQSGSLPPKWRAVTDEDGDVYYWNEVSCGSLFSVLVACCGI